MLSDFPSGWAAADAAYPVRGVALRESNCHGKLIGAEEVRPVHDGEIIRPQAAITALGEEARE